jgi:hypothetical protein
MHLLLCPKPTTLSLYDQAIFPVGERNQPGGVNSTSKFWLIEEVVIDVSPKPQNPLF